MSDEDDDRSDAGLLWRTSVRRLRGNGEEEAFLYAAPGTWTGKCNGQGSVRISMDKRDMRPIRVRTKNVFIRQKCNGSVDEQLIC